MPGKVGQRAVNLLVLLFAAYAFAFVPLGRRTGLDHLRAILSTGAAREAGRELIGAADRLRLRFLGDDPPAPARGTPDLPTLPRSATPAPRNAGLARSPGLEAPDASR